MKPEGAPVKTYYLTVIAAIASAVITLALFQDIALLARPVDSAQTLRLAQPSPAAAALASAPQHRS
jgi:hypothetical protein